MTRAEKNRRQQLYRSTEYRLAHAPVRELSRQELDEALRLGHLTKLLYDAELSRRYWQETTHHLNSTSRRLPSRHTGRAGLGIPQRPAGGHSPSRAPLDGTRAA